MNVSSVILRETDIFFIKRDDKSHKCSVALQNIPRFHGNERVKFRLFLTTLCTFTVLVNTSGHPTLKETKREKTADGIDALGMTHWCQYCRFHIVVTNTSILVPKYHSICTPVRAKSNQ